MDRCRVYDNAWYPIADVAVIAAGSLVTENVGPIIIKIDFFRNFLLFPFEGVRKATLSVLKKVYWKNLKKCPKRIALIQLNLLYEDIAKLTSVSLAQVKLIADKNGYAKYLQYK